MKESTKNQLIKDRLLNRLEHLHDQLQTNRELVKKSLNELDPSSIHYSTGRGIGHFEGSISTLLDEIIFVSSMIKTL